MADAFKKLAQVVLGTTPSTLYTVPGATEAIVKHIRMVNTSGSDTTVKLWHDGSADGNVILPAVTVKAGGWAEFDGALLMEAADTLQGEAGAVTSITVTAYGDEVT